ncbi:TrkH family potassium uptake protein [Notoacmeibacter sp. MSK16QG-6]|uniref:TrkH family potassium uptake protein n=1 Tax=Notoacmeibacter sp. MSK16QG-6 TaxID=2957982 RepID=UPI0020A1599A|nr:TrkH family potassium uptake protein [Notoacmeibacter sp. MSK16QG-6]MCP1199418.1 TrkH family potassium uptake protein [Notoacmeibacter sp. MSK16QG-6]
MNLELFRTALHIAAHFALYLAIAMLCPGAADLYVGNPDWRVFAMTSFIVAGIALAVILSTRGPAPRPSVRLAFLVVNILWLTLSVAGAMPLYFSSLPIDFIHALFESVSAVTTTGSTVISGLDELPPGLLLWRSLLQWIGGIGVIALGLFILPYLRLGGFSYFRIESSDIEDRPFARFSTFSIALVSVYLGLTFLCGFCYLIGGMSPFDAVNHALTTMATGGFSTHDASFGFFSSPWLIWTATIFMALAGLPFTILAVVAFRRQTDAFHDPQIETYLLILLGLISVCSIWLIVTDQYEPFDAFTHSAFTFVSIVTTTGYATEDYSGWGPLGLLLAFTAMWLGGCSGSTAGGIKTYRFVILWQAFTNNLKQLLFQRIVSPIRYGERVVTGDMEKSVALFVASYVCIWVLLSVALAASGLDIMTSLTGALTAISNVGPGLGTLIGPAGNFQSLNDISLSILMVGMFLGRLEIATVLMLLMPIFWRR